MTETKFTPGPWVVGRDLVGHVSREDDQSYGMIMPVAYIERYDFPDSHEANAHLIAAAPDLLEALQKMVKMASSGMVDFNPHDEFVMSSARSALAKARGEA